jgi:hypothetical protein
MRSCTPSEGSPTTILYATNRRPKGYCLLHSGWRPRLLGLRKALVHLACASLLHTVEYSRGR